MKENLTIKGRAKWRTNMKTKINLKEFKGSVIAAVTICVVLLVLSMALGSSREKTTQKKTEVTVELGSTTQLSLIHI